MGDYNRRHAEIVAECNRLFASGDHAGAEAMMVNAWLNDGVSVWRVRYADGVTCCYF